MDIPRLIAELRAELLQIDEAILALQRLGLSGGKRRGRPPKWMSETKAVGDVAPLKKKKRFISAEARKRMAEAQKKRWAGVKKAAQE